MAKNTVSVEVQEEALLIAKKTQKQGQSKEQTKLIAQGIQKGIADYKKSAKNKQRQTDKFNKQKRKDQNSKQIVIKEDEDENQSYSTMIPWGLLGISWLGFIVYFYQS